MKNKFSLVILILFIIMMFVSIFNVVKKNSLASENVDLKSEISILEEENEQKKEASESTKTEEETNNDESSENPSNEEEKKESETEQETENNFSEDIEWFLENLYTKKNKRESYDTVKDSASESLLKSQFGEELPPENAEDEENGVDNKIEDVDVYGKYENDSTYKALVEFKIVSNYEDKTDESKHIIEVIINKENDKWIIDEIDEKSK